MRSEPNARFNALACALSAHAENESIDRVMRTSFWCVRRTSTSPVVALFPTSKAPNSIP